MLFSLIGNGLAADASAASARRLRHFGFHARRALERARQRCDLALRAWGARRLVREMQSWPDERLRDIGLSRAEIVSAIEGVKRPFRWVPDHNPTQIDPTRFGH